MASLAAINAKSQARTDARLAPLFAKDPSSAPLLARFKELDAARYGGVNVNALAAAGKAPAQYTAEQGAIRTELLKRGVLERRKQDWGDKVSKFASKATEVAIVGTAAVGLAYGGAAAFGAVGAPAAPAAVATPVAAAPGASITLAPYAATAASSGYVAPTAVGIWPTLTKGAGEVLGAAKSTVELAGAVASTKLIVDSLSGRRKEISNSETVPPGWSIENVAPGAAPAAADNGGLAGALAGIPWVPLMIVVAAIAIGAR